MASIAVIGLLIGLAALIVGVLACIAAWLVVPFPELLNLGVHGDPERVARAWLEAASSTNCDKAMTYVVPDDLMNLRSRCEDLIC